MAWQCLILSQKTQLVVRDEVLVLLLSSCRHSRYCCRRHCRYVELSSLIRALLPTTRLANASSITLEHALQQVPAYRMPMWPHLCGVSGTRKRPSAGKGEQQRCVMCFLPGVDSDGGFARSSQGLAVRCQHCHRTHARTELILVGHPSRQCGKGGGALRGRRNSSMEHQKRKKA